jgi:hypothetical protein
MSPSLIHDPIRKLPLWQDGFAHGQYLGLRIALETILAEQANQEQTPVRPRTRTGPSTTPPQVRERAMKDDYLTGWDDAAYALSEHHDDRDIVVTAAWHNLSAGTLQFRIGYRNPFHHGPADKGTPNLTQSSPDDGSPAGLPATRRVE